MIKGLKRGVLAVRLYTSKDATSKFKSKCRDMWAIIKQVWYVPFIWSLAWFSYWIFQESIVMGHPLTQGSIFNQIGLAISIVAILIAGYISGKSSEKHFEKTGKIGIERKSSSMFPEASSRENSAESFLPKELSQKTQYDRSEQWREPSELYSQIEANLSREPDETPLNSSQTLVSTRNTHEKVNRSDQIEQQEIPSECLICPNLTSCDQRRNLTAGSKTSCPQTKDNPR